MALEMKFGGNPRQNALLGVLLLVLAYLLYTNVFSAPDYVASTPAPTPPPPAAPKAGPLPPTAGAPKKTAASGRSMDFRPRIGAARPEDRPDPMTVDPTLRLELLAKLEKVQFAGGMRSLFDFSNISAPTTPSGAPVPKIVPRPTPPPRAFIGPMEKPPDPPPPPKPPPPQAPPIPLKYFGYASAPKSSARRAFFLDGEDIVIGAEGQVLKNRYKVIRIGLTNVTMEDLQFNQQQSLPIAPEGFTGGL
jgi:hypothetical protein